MYNRKEIKEMKRNIKTFTKHTSLDELKEIKITIFDQNKRPFYGITIISFLQNISIEVNISGRIVNYVFDHLKMHNARLNKNDCIILACDNWRGFPFIPETYEEYYYFEEMIEQYKNYLKSEYNIDFKIDTI